MTRMIRQSMVAYATPLCETVAEAPEPRGTEVLVRISRCGVCHSDLHLYDGYFSLGGDKKLDVTAFRSLPFTLGHEIAGVVEKAGPDADAKIGSSAAVFPWIGCGECAACKAGEENLCAAPRHLGIQVDGGFATHVLVPHPRYLIDHGSLPASLAGAYMCSGLTAFAALKRLTEHAKRGPILLVGIGGVGMMGLAFALALFPHKPIVADVDPAKREAALKVGAAAAYDPADPNARKALLKATGGVAGAVDFAGTDGSLAFAVGSHRQGRQGRHHRPDRRQLRDADRDVPAESHEHRGHHDRHARGSRGDDGARPRRQNSAGADPRAAALRRAGLAR